MDGDEQRTPAYKWPGQWVRQESFWREVGTRTLAAVFAAGIIFVFALLGGYINTPGRAFTAYVLAFGIFGLINALRTYMRAKHRMGRVRTAFAYVLLAVLIASLVLIVVRAVLDAVNG